MKRKKIGFTLIEMVIVIAIIILLTSALSFTVSTYVDKSNYVATAASDHVNKYADAKRSVKNLNLAVPATTTTLAEPAEPTPTAAPTPTPLPGEITASPTPPPGEITASPTPPSGEITASPTPPSGEITASPTPPPTATPIPTPAPLPVQVDGVTTTIRAGSWYSDYTYRAEISVSPGPDQISLKGKTLQIVVPDGAYCLYATNVTYLLQQNNIITVTVGERSKDFRIYLRYTGTDDYYAIVISVV